MLFQPDASEQGTVVIVGSGGSEAPSVACHSGTAFGTDPVGSVMVELPKIIVPFPQSEKMVWY